MAIPTMLAPPGSRDMTLPSKAAVSAGSPLAVKLLQVEIVVEGEVIVEGEVVEEGERKTSAHHHYIHPHPHSPKVDSRISSVHLSLCWLRVFPLGYETV